MPELENVRALPRRQQVVLRPGEEIWRDSDHVALARRAVDAHQRGEVSILQLPRERNKYGQYVMVVRRLKAERKRRPEVGAWLVPLLAAGSAVVLGIVVWRSQVPLLFLAGYVLLVLVGAVVARRRS